VVGVAPPALVCVELVDAPGVVVVVPPLLEWFAFSPALALERFGSDGTDCKSPVSLTSFGRK